MQRQHLKTTESDFGSAAIKRMPESVPSVHMFHKVHFLWFFERFVLNNPRLSSLEWSKKNKTLFFISFSTSFLFILIVWFFFFYSLSVGFERGPCLSSLLACSFCLYLAPRHRFWLRVKSLPSVSSSPRPIHSKERLQRFLPKTRDPPLFFFMPSCENLMARNTPSLRGKGVGPLKMFLC